MAETREINSGIPVRPTILLLRIVCLVPAIRVLVVLINLDS